VLPVRYELNLCMLCGLVVRVPGYRTEMCCASCEVRSEFIYVVLSRLPRQGGILNVSHSYRSPWPVTVIATFLLFYLLSRHIVHISICVWIYIYVYVCVYIYH
jgi:hypothetical protein